MDKTKLAASIIVSISLIISSLILAYGMAKLGESIETAGAVSNDLSLSYKQYGHPIRVVLDDDSQLRLKTDQDPND
jgi:hypothetical protein